MAQTPQTTMKRIAAELGVSVTTISKVLNHHGDISEATRDRVLAKYFWLLPLRDGIALGVWVMSFFGREVVWRDARYRLEPGGKIRPA